MKIRRKTFILCLLALWFYIIEIKGVSKSSKELALFTDGEEINTLENETYLLKSRNKRWVGSIYRIASVSFEVFTFAYGAVSIGLNIADYSTDGAVFYPSITGYKQEIEKLVGEFKQLEPQMKDLQKRYKKAFSDHDTIYWNTKKWFNIMKQINDIILEAREEEREAMENAGTKFEGLVYELENLMKQLEKHGVSMDGQATIRDKMFWTSMGVSAFLNMYSLGSLAKSIKLEIALHEMKHIERVLSAADDVNMLIDADGTVYLSAEDKIKVDKANLFKNKQRKLKTGKRPGKIKRTLKKISHSWKRFSRGFKKVTGYQWLKAKFSRMSKGKKQTFRNFRQLASKPVNSVEAKAMKKNYNKLRVGKTEMGLQGLAVLGLGLQIYGTYWQVESALQRRDQLKEVLGQYTAFKKDLTEELRAMPKRIEELEQWSLTRGRTLKYLLETQKNVTCEGNTIEDFKELSEIVHLNADRTLELVLEQLSRFLGLKRGINGIANAFDLSNKNKTIENAEMIFISVCNPKAPCDRAETIKATEMIRDLGYETGTWGEWYPTEKCINRCGRHLRKRERQCYDSKCIGLNNQVQVCGWIPFNETAYEDCVNKTIANNTDVINPVIMSGCEKVENGQPAYDYFAIQNKLTGKVITTSKSEDFDLILQNRTGQLYDSKVTNIEDNQIWRWEEDGEGENKTLTCKYYGRPILRDNDDTITFKLQNGRLKDDLTGLVLGIESDRCKNSSSNRSENDVYLQDEDTTNDNPCQQWIILPYLDPSQITTTSVSPMLSSQQTTDSSGNISKLSKFLENAGVKHLLPIFVENGLTVDQIPKLTSRILRDVFEVTNWQDRLKILDCVKNEVVIC